ncbi:hypothetical protein IU485_01740 [Nocardia cyriacigeorgica]|uniref:hypothetical protein n=1 Tax=Nocardia cyriacigeorgica TaxID=135487 RepID=UPI0006626A8E|nr:hypothetical protein [Nocardia cyriacigeorgica]MBF6080080.1 hypothetical protein [Nocardia cyriacigeorgica]MBF6289647.1 hypothetical protein [Nocardia cyriacigeorgica]MBF6427611.1 hypothetical protein [Nocardia cyriacigeorgica]BDT87199.1 hypothetical protein FMUAM8_29630 [Nocardia cyriacigeorgica]
MFALGWIDPSSPTPDWDAAQIRRLARRLGYPVCWADSPWLGLVEQIESCVAEIVIVPSSAHIDAITLNRVMAIADVECAAPRTSFARWTIIGGRRR